MTDSIDFNETRYAALGRGGVSNGPLPRLCYAAAHVVMQDGYAEILHAPETPGTARSIAEQVDWTATMTVRESIGASGMGIAEAMDTAQRFSLGWDTARELIERTGRLKLEGGFCAGASTDHLEAIRGTKDLVDGVCEQVGVIRAAGGIPVLLPMPLLAREDTSPEGYVSVYGDIIRNVEDGPLILHWLGPMFLAELEGYFPGDSFERIMRIDPGRVRGAKLSMLDHDLERRLRRILLEEDQIMLTGDDFHFGSLMMGEGEPTGSTELAGREVLLGDFSHALLGIFDAIAHPAAHALRLLASGDRTGCREIMTRCEALGQCVFETPTQHYKTGLAFIAWLNGHQSNRMLVNHEENRRDRAHLIRVAHLANACGAITDGAVARERFEAWMKQEA
jgi:hypothetical protein